MTKKQPTKNNREGVDNYGRNQLHYAALASDIAQLSERLVAGDDCNLKDDNGWTPLHFAAQSQSAQAVQKLLANGASVDSQDNNGNTPLWRAVFNYRGDFGPIELLLAAGADAWKENDHGVSAFELGTDTDDLVLEKFFRGLHMPDPAVNTDAAR